MKKAPPDPRKQALVNQKRSFSSCLPEKCVSGHIFPKYEFKGAKYFAPDFFVGANIQSLSDNEAAVMGERVMWEQRKASPPGG